MTTRKYISYKSQQEIVQYARKLLRNKTTKDASYTGVAGQIVYDYGKAILTIGYSFDGSTHGTIGDVSSLLLMKSATDDIAHWFLVCIEIEEEFNLVSYRSKMLYYSEHQDLSEDEILVKVGLYLN
jgi:hypothetical protein